ncbi:MAG: copper amine oxidase N-terminal domain-containing protein [Clostridiales bacterium]|nr:copper amine oxidase N-terminal domain-containing protein [uncultured Anaerotignum sp.]MBS6174896.1 copper amine oxidase N-terminal domain-containing protein [Clostridiales bacterium]
MKKFLSMVMAAAMVVSLVPATAFAASGDVKATAKVVDAKNYTEKEIDTAKGKVTGPEAQLTFTTADLTSAGSELTFTFTLDNAKITKADNGTVKEITASVKADDESGVTVKTKYVDEDEFDVTIEKTESTKLTRGDVLKVSIDGVTMEKYSKGKEATISVDSDDVTVTNGDDLVFASVESKGIKASVKDTVDVATEEVAELKEVKLEPSVGEKFGSVLSAGDQIKLKLNSGFEFSESDVKLINMDGNEMTVLSINDADSDEDEIVIDVTGNMNTDVIKIQNLKVEATSAKAGATATLKVYATGCDTVSVEVAKVVDYTVSMTVDEDEDVPVIYSGVDVKNTGITDDSDHDALEVTIKESFAGAWNNSKDFTLSLPEGVYVADEISTSTDGDFKLTTSGKTTEQWFQDAYDEGDYIDLTFKRRTWEETNPNDTNKDDPAEISFTLKLVADPNFEGDVVLKLTGDAVEEQEVTIAKFVKPYVVEAQQNDMQIDYRNTEIPTSVVIKEAEAGLWDKNTEFKLELDKIDFDDEGTIKVDEKSGLEIKDNEIKEKDGVLYFTVDSRSDDEPAVVTLSGMQLYMDRSLPAGAYDLDVWSPTMLADKFNNDGDVADDATKGYLAQAILKPASEKENKVIADINDDFYSETAKAGFVNIVTAGREDTDSFTTKVVVPVGEKYVISGETKQEIPVPAYINADGYTMLPLRAVSVALGINSNNVLWDQATRTATVMYGSKIISMTYGQKVVYVNAAPIPASTSVEIKENRMFLGLRDLGNALGVTDITWDAATKTATLNGNK